MKETAPGTDFSKFVAHFLPNRQHFFYGHAAFFTHGPDYPPARKSKETAKTAQHHLEPADHISVGKMRLAYIPDEGNCPFKVCLDRDPEKEIKLRTYDGHGFIKRSVAAAMPGYQKLEALQEEARRSGKEPHWYGQGDGQIPAQGWKYYPNDPEVVPEIVAELEKDLEDYQAAHPGEPFPPSLLHRCFTSGNLRVRVSIALPSSDEQLRLPEKKSVSVNDYPPWDGQGERPSSITPGNPGVLARSPFNGQALIAIEEINVKTPEQGDLTSQYLSRTNVLQLRGLVQARKVLQNGAVESESVLSPEDRFGSFQKGLLTVVDDKDWPDDFKDVDVALPSGDRKTHSKALGVKEEYKEVTRVDIGGMFACSEVYPAQSLAAVPPEIWKELGGDFDGDPMLFIHLVREYSRCIDAAAGKVEEQKEILRVKEIRYPALFNFLLNCDKRRRDKGIISLKPPKELTSAFEIYEGLSLETAEKISAWLGMENEADAAQLHREIASELAQQCRDMAANHPDSVAHQILVLRAKFRQWGNTKDQQAAIAEEILESLPALISQEMNRAPAQALDMDLYDRITRWSRTPNKEEALAIVEVLQQAYEQKTGFDAAAVTFAKLLELTHAVGRWEGTTSSEDNHKVKDGIALALDDTPVGGELYAFSRAKEFMATRLNLMQDFARWQEIYYFVNSKKRHSVAEEIVKTFFEGMAEDTAADIATLLHDKLDENEVTAAFEQVVNALEAQQEDPQVHKDVRQQIGELRQALQIWWKHKTSVSDKEVANVDADAMDVDSPHNKDSWDDEATLVDPEEASRSAVWDILDNIPRQQFKIPEDWPKKELANSESWPAYYEDIAELWLSLGSYIGTDIYKTAGEMARLWKAASQETDRLFKRLQKEGTYGVTMQVPYGKWVTADTIKYGTDPDDYILAMGDCDNLEADIRRGVTALFKAKYPKIFLGTQAGTAHSHRPIADTISVDDNLRALRPDINWTVIQTQIEQKQFRYVASVVPWLIEVVLDATEGKAARHLYVQLDETGKIVRCTEMPQRSTELDSRYGPIAFPKKIKKWERDATGVVIDNPTRQVLRPGDQLQFDYSELQAIAKGELWLKWVIDLEGNLVVGKEIAGVDGNGNPYPAHQRKLLGHPNLTLGLPARIGGKIRVERIGDQLKLVIDNHSTRYSTYASRNEAHLDNAIQRFNESGLLKLNWQGAIGKMPIIDKHWYVVHESGKRFIEGPDAESAQEEDTSELQIKNWAEFRHRLESDPPQTNFAQVAMFVAQQARYWKGKRDEKQIVEPFPSYDWATLLQSRLPALFLHTKDEAIHKADIGRWSNIFALLSAAAAPPTVIDEALKHTTQLLWSKQERVTGWEVVNQAYQAGRLPEKERVAANLKALRIEITQWLTEGLSRLGYASRPIFSRPGIGTRE